MLKELKRQRLQTLARALSERNDLLLRLGNTSQTDLKNVEVRDTEEIVPGVPASPVERWLALKASTAHESGHIIFTDRKAWQEAVENPLLAHILNVIEDARIERAMANAYPGTLLWLRFLNYYIYKNRQDWGEGLNGFLSGLCSYAVTGLVPASLPADIKALIDRCKPLVDQGREARDTWGALEQAREILALVRSVFPESPPPPPAIVGTHSPREAPDGPLDPRRRVSRLVREEPAHSTPEENKPDNESGAPGSKPREADEPNESDESHSEPDAVSSKRDESGDEDEGSHNKPSEPDGPGDSSDQPDNPDDESGEVDEPELGSDQPDEREEPGDGSEEPGEAEPDARDEPDAPNERDDPGNASGESDTPDDPNEWDDSDAPDESDGPEGDPEEPDPGKGEPDEADPGVLGDEGEPDTDEWGDSETPEAGGAPGSPYGPPGGDPEPGEDPKALDDEDFSALLEDAEKELSKMESDAERQEKEAARERVPEPDWEKLRADVSKDIHAGCSFSWSELLPNPSYYQKLRSAQQGLIQRLTEEIRRALEFRATAPRRNLKKGHLDASGLWKLRVPDPRVFVRRDTPGDVPTLAVYLLVDCSGSMSELAVPPPGSRRGPRETKIALARRAAVALHEVCVNLKIAHRVAGFNSRHPRTTFYNAVKWDERDGSRIASLSPGESNRDGYAIRVAARELAARPEPRKVLLVLSDGLPSDDGDHRYRLTPLAYADTAKAVREAERDGIGVIGLFFGSYDDRETAQTIYDQMIYVQDASYLPLLLGRVLKKVIAGGA